MNFVATRAAKHSGFPWRGMVAEVAQRIEAIESLAPPESRYRVPASVADRAN